MVFPRLHGASDGSASPSSTTAASSSTAHPRGTAALRIRRLTFSEDSAAKMVFIPEVVAFFAAEGSTHHVVYIYNIYNINHLYMFYIYICMYLFVCLFTYLDICSNVDMNILYMCYIHLWYDSIYIYIYESDMIMYEYVYIYIYIRTTIYIL